MTKSVAQNNKISKKLNRYKRRENFACALCACRERATEFMDAVRTLWESFVHAIGTLSGRCVLAVTGK